jgi:hypothetical protein
MVTARKYVVGLVQMRMGADPEANFAAAVEHVREAARRGAQVICLPELFRAQYFCQREDVRLFDLAEAIPGPSTSKLGELARELRVAVVASLFERRAPGLYHNTAVTLNADGAIAGVYRKMHIPDDPLYYEKFYFAPGDLGFQAVDTGVWARGHAGLLGSVVSRGRAADGPARSGGPVLSDRDWMASGGERGVWRGAIRRVADDPAGPCDCQRGVCGGGESRGPGARRRFGKSCYGAGHRSSGAEAFWPIRLGG